MNTRLNPFSSKLQLIFDGSLIALSGAGAPTLVTPEYIGQTYYDTINDVAYIASGLTQGDWLDVSSVIGGGDFDLVLNKCDTIDSLVPDVILTDTGANALQTAITALTDGQVLEIKSNAIYNSIEIPSGKAFTVKVATGYSPKITGQCGILLKDGASNVLISGIGLENCTTSDSNGKGTCIALEHRGKVQDIIFHRIAFCDVGVGSGVLISYHQSLDGDNYAIANLLSEMSERISFVRCHFNKACNSSTEGACLGLRGVNSAFISDNRIDNAELGGRGIQLQNCIKSLTEKNRVRHIGGSNAEGIKLDKMGSPTYRNSGVLRDNKVKNCIEGIDIDDTVDAILTRNTISYCLNEGISIDDSAKAYLVGNICYFNKDGIRLENGSIAILESNTCFGNTDNNFRIENGYTVPDCNEESCKYTSRIPTAESIPYEVGNTNTFESVKAVLDNITEIPEYADNATAKVAGLVEGEFYHTSTGVLMVVY